MTSLSAGAPRVDEALALARELPIDQDELRATVEHLAGLGSSPLGFRTTGTPEDREAAEYAAAAFRAIGLEDVAIEEVRVDGWRFEGATLEAGVVRCEASSMGGVPATPGEGLEAPLVDVAAARPRRLDRLDLTGRLVLVDWMRETFPLCDIALELGLRGAIGVIANCPEGADFYQSPGVIGSFDAHWHEGAPPMILIAKEDAARLREALPERARMTLRATRTPGGRGANAVGYLPGEEAGAPIVIGAHHDGWFRAAFDNATGVAALLAIARGLVAAGHRPRHTLCFTSRTAEEYGLEDSPFDWCVGAWRQVSETHPEWGENVPFHLCLEASGHPGLRLALEAPAELREWARGACRAGRREGWLPTSWRVAKPGTGTELWPFLVSGVPGITVLTWEKAFMRSDYHTPRDTLALLDFDHLEGQTRFYAYLLLQADADPDGILDHGARAEELAKLDGLPAPADRHGRAGFTAIGRELVAVDAHGVLAYPHKQAAHDAERLQAALDALRRDQPRAAAKALTGVGANALAPRLSAAAFARHAHRRTPDGCGDSWAQASHLTASPELWAEIASLTGRPGAQARGPWIEQSLERHLADMREELARRIEAMARTLEDTERRTP
jgi:Iap family predicted aminopeptidase